MDNPRIDPRSIDLFHQVYYPIAKVELEMDEKCFGDFDTIEKTVLELIGAGFDSVDTVSDLLGVPKLFAQNIFSILSGYGHIDAANHITELGKNSLQSDVKITEVLTKQVVSIDALNGCPINIEKSVVNSEMVDINTIAQDRIIIPSATEAETAAFLKQLNSAANIHAMSKKRQVININVTNIRDSMLIKTEYASAYLMHLKNVATPVIFTKMYDPFKEVFSERFTWQPLSIDASNKHLFDAAESHTVHTSTVASTLVGIYQYISEKNSSENDSKAAGLLLEDLEKHYKIRPEFVTLDRSCCNGTVSASAFTQVNMNVLNLLMSFAKYGVFVYADNRIHGKVVMLTPDSSVSPAVLIELKEKAANRSFSELLELLSAEPVEATNMFGLIQNRLSRI